jgi:hypothetical protein
MSLNGLKGNIFSTELANISLFQSSAYGPSRGDGCVFHLTQKELYIKQHFVGVTMPATIHFLRRTKIRIAPKLNSETWVAHGALQIIRNSIINQDK